MFRLFLSLLVLFLSSGLSFAQFPIEESFRSTSVTNNWTFGKLGSFDPILTVNGGIDSDGNGALRLNSGAGQLGYAYLNQNFALSTGISLEFNFDSYTSAFQGADGFAIILYDSEDVTFQPGDGGSNLGYRGTASGNFFLGVGISGSYPGNDFTGGPNRIAVRSDKNFVVSSLATYSATSQLEFPSTSSRPSDISPSNQRRIRVTLTPDDSLLIDLKYGENEFSRVISLNNISNSLVANPDSFRIAILGSSGGAGSTKEIRDLIIDRAGNTSTGSASLITESSARLNGAVYAIEDNTTATFYYGTESGNLGSSVAANLSPVDSGYYSVFADLADLMDDTRYYYQMESANTTETLTGSERNFATLPEEPLTYAMAASDSAEVQQIFLTWTPVEGTETIVLVSDNSENFTEPVDGVTYSSNFDYQNAPILGDMRIVYAGDSDSIAVTGLDSETSYYFYLFTYAPGSYNNPNYLTSAYESVEVTTDQLPFGDYISDFSNSVRNAKLADVNGDGLVDIVAVGYDLLIYYNNGEGFNEPQSFDLSDGGYYPAIEVADFNMDGNADIFFVMESSSGIMMSGEGFSWDYDETFPTSYASMSAVLDFNKDGLPDILLSNSNTGNFKMYLNTNPGFEEIDLGFRAKYIGSIAVADFNKDGYDDFAYSGAEGDAYTGRDAAIYINNSGTGFTRNPTKLTGAHQADLKILDYNNDTYPDFIYSGSLGDGDRIINLVINNQDGTFTQETEENGGGGEEGPAFANASAATISLPPPSAAVGLAIADYNNDGFDDIFIAGTPDGYYDSEGSVWINNGESGFSEYISGTFAIVIENRAMAADFNNDGMADFIVSGYSDDEEENGFVLYKNNLEVLNVAPGTPNGLDNEVTNNLAELSWEAPMDDETAALRYVVIVGTDQAEGTVIPTVVREGTSEYLNAGYNTSFLVNNLAPGTYYWQVRAVDGGFAYSDWSAAGTFDITTPLPIPAPTGLSLSLNEGVIGIEWNPVEVDTLKYYFVYVGTDPENLSRVDTTDEGDPYDVYTEINNLIVGATYYVAVSSVDTNDTEGNLSFIRSIFIPPFALEYYSYFSNYRENMVAADLNQDGRMDIITTGESGGGDWVMTGKKTGSASTEDFEGQSLNILINTSNEPEAEFFTPEFSSFESVEAVAVADFTGDTRPDILTIADGSVWLLINIIGEEGGPYESHLISENYYMNGYPDMVTGDFDNNMRMDFAVVSDNQCAIFYQTDYLVFSEEYLPVSSLDDGSISTADFDLDGDLDLLITGNIYSEGGGEEYALSATIPSGVNTLLLENVGGETGWEYLDGAGLPGVYRGGAEFADFTADGYPDIVLSGRGEDGESRNFGVFKNNGDKTFTEISVPGAGLAAGNIKTGDLNNDGLTDFILLGAYISRQYMSMNAYLNNGDETFTALDSTTFNPVWQGDLVLADLDGDSDLDIVVTGEFNDGSGGGGELVATPKNGNQTELTDLDGDYLAVYINNFSNDLSDPMPPTEVLVSADYDTLSVSFNAGSDEETPVEALTYNIRVISADSLGYFETFTVSADSESGASFVAQAGMVGMNKSWSFTNVPDGNYYVSVQTVDASFRTSAFTEGEFVTINQTVPVELSSFTAAVNDQSVNLIWSTTTEKENAGFGIERKSTEKDSKWVELGFVEGNGTTAEPQSYSFSDQPGTGSFTYRLRQTDLDGSVSYSSLVEVTIEKPLEYALSQNYPNPFNPVTRINYSIKVQGQVQLVLYDILGRQVRELVNEVKPAGSYVIDLDASGLSSGVYFYRIHSGEFSKVMKMTLLK